MKYMRRQPKGWTVTRGVPKAENADFWAVSVLGLIRRHGVGMPTAEMNPCLAVARRRGGGSATTDTMKATRVSAGEVALGLVRAEGGRFADAACQAKPRHEGKSGWGFRQAE